jgi:hypothetical protein
MPVPKGKEKLYGKIVGHLQNLGFSYETAKNKTDKAIKDSTDTKGMKQRKSSTTR